MDARTPTVEHRQEIIAIRQTIIVIEAGGAITAEEFCREHRRRGWAFDDLTPARLGLRPARGDRSEIDDHP